MRRRYKPAATYSAWFRNKIAINMLKSKSENKSSKLFKQHLVTDHVRH